jgi:GTPase SAR1 family protein
MKSEVKMERETKFDHVFKILLIGNSGVGKSR